MHLNQIHERLEWAKSWISNIAHTKVNNALGGNMRMVTFDEFLYFKGLDNLVIDDSGFIPKMVDPMGKYWNQPYLSNILLRGDYAELNKYCFDILAEYNSTFPTGAYLGKMWKRKEGNDWFLVWYGKHDKPEMLSILFKKIKIIEANYLYMYDSQRTLIIKENVEDWDYYVKLQRNQQNNLIKAHYSK